MENIQKTDVLKLLRIVVVGVSAGGMEALRRLLPRLPATFPWPVAVVQHLHSTECGFLASHLDQICALSVVEGEDKLPIAAGQVVLAPANYHMLVEWDGTYSLSVDPPVNWCRPSADVLFESAVEVFGARTVGIVLTGANNDGAAGFRKIREAGGVAAVQDPSEAEFPSMPMAAMEAATPDAVLRIDDIAPWLADMADAEPGGTRRMSSARKE